MGQESPMLVTRTRSGENMVRPQPVTEQSLMESVAGKKYCVAIPLQSPVSFSYSPLYPSHFSHIVLLLSLLFIPLNQDPSPISQS